VNRPLRFVCAALLVAQVLIPLVQLGSERGSRWGWQMFSSIQAEPVFAVRRGERLDTLSTGDFVARARPEARLDEYVPRFLCARDPSVEAVVIVPTGLATETREVACPAP
jgi:hypothetical protein